VNKTFLLKPRYSYVNQIFVLRTTYPLDVRGLAEVNVSAVMLDYSGVGGVEGGIGNKVCQPTAGRNVVSSLPTVSN
jgi:hypothetical protein